MKYDRKLKHNSVVCIWSTKPRKAVVSCVCYFASLSIFYVQLLNIQLIHVSLSIGSANYLYCMLYCLAWNMNVGT